MSEAERKPRQLTTEQIGDKLGRTFSACHQRLTLLRAQRQPTQSQSRTDTRVRPGLPARPWSQEETTLLMAELDRQRPWKEVYTLFPSRTRKACEQKASEVRKARAIAHGGESSPAEKTDPILR